jgi:hypothetical protein
MVDAYSVGKTFRYMMTGVPPHRGVEAAIAEQKSPINRLSRWAKKRLSDGKPPKKRKVQYRLESELPMEVQQLITDLTKRKEDERTSVRRARGYPWIEEVLPTSTKNNNTGEQEQTEYLACALKWNKESLAAPALLAQ